jgi:hypothetical protein
MKLLQEWYSSHCDGTWEKTNGIKIDTVAEGGWFLRIDLLPAETVELLTHFVPVERSSEEFPNDWMSLKIMDWAMIGGCAPELFVALSEVAEAAIAKMR